MLYPVRVSGNAVIWIEKSNMRYSQWNRFAGVLNEKTEIKGVASELVPALQ